MFTCLSVCTRKFVSLQTYFFQFTFFHDFWNLGDSYLKPILPLILYLYRFFTEKPRYWPKVLHKPLWNDFSVLHFIVLHEKKIHCSDNSLTVFYKYRFYHLFRYNERKIVWLRHTQTRKLNVFVTTDAEWGEFFCMTFHRNLDTRLFWGFWSLISTKLQNYAIVILSLFFK